MSDPPAPLPADLVLQHRTALFSETTIPAALLRGHATEERVWAVIRVASGRLRYRVTDPRRPASDVLLTAGEPGVVEPTIRHQVEPVGAVRFHLDFFRAAPIPLCRFEELARRENRLRAEEP